MSHAFQVDQSIGQITLDLGDDVNLTLATVVEVEYVKPDGTSGAWTATSNTATTITYDFQNGDLDQAGTYLIQGYWEIAGENARSHKGKFKVLPNII
jgi:hypothetical protein